jgi:hypothetical protein
MTIKFKIGRFLTVKKAKQRREAAIVETIIIKREPKK